MGLASSLYARLRFDPATPRSLQAFFTRKNRSDAAIGGTASLAIQRAATSGMTSTDDGTSPINSGKISDHPCTWLANRGV
jgi:hypothetical protein